MPEHGPQVITASNDYTIRLWDLAAGKTMATFTNNKKSVRGLVLHPKLFMFASGGRTISNNVSGACRGQLGLL